MARWCKTWSVPRGETMALEAGWKLAQAWFHDRLSPDFRRKSVDEIHALWDALGLTSPFWRLT